MRIIDLGDTTTQYEDPTWVGAGFDEPQPQQLWSRLPESLRRIATDEIALGNSPRGILENRRGNIVVLIFRTGPLIARTSDAQVRVHTQFDSGNYCYDDTNATFEDLETGSFLAFDEPVAAEEQPSNYRLERP
jgi:hypothetical protein